MFNASRLAKKLNESFKDYFGPKSIIKVQGRYIKSYEVRERFIFGNIYKISLTDDLDQALPIGQSVADTLVKYYGGERIE